MSGGRGAARGRENVAVVAAVAGLAILFVGAAFILLREDGKPPRKGGRKKDRKKLELRLRLREGQKFVLRVEMSMQHRQQLPGGKPIETEMNLGIENVFSVRAIDAAGQADLDVSYRAIRFKQDGLLGLIEYDSANPPAQVHPAAQGHAFLVGKSFSMTVSPTGEVSEVRGMGELIEQFLGEVQMSDKSMSALLRKSMMQQFSNQAVRKQMTRAMAVYPDRPVGIGDSWTKTATTSFSQEMETTWTLRKRRGGTAVVGVKSVLAANPEGGGREAGPLGAKTTFSGRHEGEIEIEEATGLIRKARLTYDFSGTMTTESMSWLISIKGEMVFSNLDE